MKQKISLTLSDDLVRDVDKRVDGTLIVNRSHAIEVLIKKAMEQEVVTQALILAGGKGTRLKPFTYEMPKPMIPVKDKPIMEHIINQLRLAGIRDIIVSVGYKAEKIIGYFGDGSKFGVRIDYIIEDKPLGTAGPLLLARNKLDKTFLMLNGDIISNIDFEDFVRFHKNLGGIATITLTEVDDPSRFGVVELKGNKIVGFVEKPAREKAPSNLVSAGIYVLNKDIFGYVNNEVQMIEDIFPLLARENKLNGYPYPGYWVDVGTIEAYEKVLNDLKSGGLGWLG